MKINTDYFLVKHYLVLYALFFLIALLCLIASHYWVDAGLGKTLLHELGFAGVVSVILIFTIEKFSRERHKLAAETLLDRINQDLFRAIYKRYIPEAVFEEVEKCIMMGSVYRESHELDYTIDAFAEDVDAELSASSFHCTAQTSYKLRNLLDQDVRHTVTILLERPLEARYDAWCTVNEVCINGAPLTEDLLTKGISRTDQHVIFRHDVDIPAGAKVDVRTRSVLIKKKTDAEIWCSRLPSDGLTLTVSTPTKGLNVKASANHSEALQQKLDNPVTRKWVLDFGIFPYQSIIFFWQPSATTTLADAK